MSEIFFSIPRTSAEIAARVAYLNATGQFSEATKLLQSQQNVTSGTPLVKFTPGVTTTPEYQAYLDSLKPKPAPVLAPQNINQQPVNVGNNITNKTATNTQEPVSNLAIVGIFVVVAGALLLLVSLK